MRLTHGGGVVYRLTRAGPRYLLVEASGTRGRWVFPKGRVEEGETGAGSSSACGALEKRRIRWLAFREALDALWARTTRLARWLWRGVLSGFRSRQPGR